MPITTDSDLKKSMAEHRLFQATALAEEQIARAKAVVTKAKFNATSDTTVVAVAQIIATNMLGAHLSKD